ncbi:MULTISPECIES: HigA family addiction module antitoxin [unclassified Methylobacterium]|uniref:HigA family addiction module antitoxin n=1 Tax=unclassified Methylobacterium TaxID=2615210 RepID=UPI0006F9C572|nr:MULTISPECIES: HigA family addiction module antitoxin [unclassified Methylobacterium]KQP61532.1 XRE family transcriptional regulator [Methylobacterium sp. Leaf108]KQT80735.1 XRE family transcriptional regulator [Methylobacterium sp. Leaf466]
MTRDVVEIVATLPPMHPGEMLREEYMVPLGLSAGTVARACGVPRTRIERIAREEIGVSADTALRLGRYLGTSAQFWINLQGRYDLLRAQESAGSDVERIEPLNRDAA